MWEDKRRVAAYLWYAVAPIPLAAVFLMWASLDNDMTKLQIVCLAITGAVIGGAALVAVGEWVRPTTVVAQTTDKPPAAPAPSIGNDNTGAEGTD